MQYLRKYFHQNWDTCAWDFPIRLKDEDHSSRRHNCRWKPVNFHLLVVCTSHLLLVSQLQCSLKSVTSALIWSFTEYLRDGVSLYVLEGVFNTCRLMVVRHTLHQDVYSRWSRWDAVTWFQGPDLRRFPHPQWKHPGQLTSRPSGRTNAGSCDSQGR